MMNNSVPTSPEEWRQYWQAKGFPWRMEPEIDTKRQEELSKCRAIVPDIEKGIYPFKGMKLSRADMEWLLATHENGRGPVDWNDEKQREREGLDMRGAELSGVDLSNLPLARICGGHAIANTRLTDPVTKEKERMAAVLLTGANLRGAHLEGASLKRAVLMKADLTEAHLESTDLRWANLAGVKFHSAHLKKVNLSNAFLEDADFLVAHVEGVDLKQAYLKNARFLVEGNLRGTFLMEAYLVGADFTGRDLEGVNLVAAHLENADLSGTHLKGADLTNANLTDANLWFARLEGASLARTNLTRTNLSRASLDGASLDGTTLSDKMHVGPYLADVHWGDTNLTIAKWSQVKILGDEYEAKRKLNRSGKEKFEITRSEEYEAAVRANRQLAIVLQNQGLNEDADRFVYRSKVLQRKVLWKQGNFWKWLGSTILALLTGYGYRMWRIIVAYLAIVLLCAVAYYVLGLSYEPHLSFLDAVLISITAFHGRVFSEPFLHPGEPQLWVTAFEAIMGLVIEGMFIAMLTQKFFGK